MRRIKDKKKLIKELVIIFLGNMLLAFSSSLFFISYQGQYIHGIDQVTNTIQSIDFDGILLGGTGGLSLILRNLFFANVANQDFVVETIITVITWLFFLMGLIFLGKRFALRTLLSTVMYPLFMYFFRLSIFEGLREQINLIDPVVCAAIGGLGTGTGCGIVYRIGGSTGGFDIPGLILNKFTRIKLSYIFLMMDGLLVILAFLADFSLYEVIIGLLSVVAYSVAVEATQRIGNDAYYCDIISDKWEEINKEILTIRGTTLVDVTGGYTNTSRKMVKTLIAKNQYLTIVDMVKRIDPNAFMSLTKTHNVFGQGYKDINEFSKK